MSYLPFFERRPVLTVLFYFCRSNHIPWIIISVCTVTSGALILLLRYLLSAENKRRDAEERDDTYDNVYIKEQLPDGTIVDKHVDRVRFTAFHDSFPCRHL